MESTILELTEQTDAPATPDVAMAVAAQAVHKATRQAMPDGPTPWDDISPAAPADPPDLHYEIPNLKSQTAIPPTQSWGNSKNGNGAAGGGVFTIPLICLGIGLIAMCLLIPGADENRRVAYERDRLQADLEQLQKQVATNEAFLKHVGDDAGLAERLARRQLRMVPEGTAVMDLKSTPAQPGMSPFLLVTIPPPAPMPPYQPVGGFLADACRHPKTQLYLIGASLLMIASGLVLSRSTPIAREGEAAA